MTFIALIGLAAVLLAFRIFGPSDLDLKDQPKTASYTLDIIENNRWVWPHDMMGNPATKPPLYNWLGAGIVYLTERTDELVLKMPSLLAIAAIFAVMYFSFKLFIPEKSVNAQQTISFFSLLVFLANVSVFVLSYAARPDMMLTCWLFTGWSCVTALIGDDSRTLIGKKVFKTLLWVSFSAALLTKGPPAALLPLYIVLVGLFQRRLKEILHRCGFAIGILLSSLPVAIWFLAALHAESDYILGTLASSEMERISSNLSMSDRIRDLYKMPFYFFVRFMPWTPFLIYFYYRFKKEVTITSWTGQAFLWVIWVIVFFSFPTFKRDDYLLPAFPVAAMLTGYFIGQIQLKWFRRLVWGAAYTVILYLGFNDIYTKEQLKPRHGDHVKRFAALIRSYVPDAKKLVFYDTGYHPLQSYLGRNQAAIKPDPEVFDQADWLVAPIDESFRPERSLYHYARLDKITESDQILKVAGRHEGKLALFKIIR